MLSLHPVILPMPARSFALSAPCRVEAQSLRAREALVLSCQASGLPCGPFEKDSRNVPLPFHGIYWSISHKPCYVTGVVSQNPVGIDIEQVTPRHHRLYEYVAGEAEWELAGPRDWEMFFRLWTAKEAVLKVTGAGIGHLKRARLRSVLGADRLLIDYAGRLWRIHHHRFDDHIVSIAHDGDVVWSLLLEDR